MSTGLRDPELRTLLVSHATRTARRARRTARVGAAAATLAVVATVAAVAVVAISPPDPLAAFLVGAEPYEMEQPDFIWADAEVLGIPESLAARQDITLQLGIPPVGATDLAVAVRCLEPGSYGVTLDDDDPAGWRVECTADDFTGRGGSGSYLPIHAEGPNALTITILSPEGRFAVWSGWVARAPDPEPSAEMTAALADGVVTREEYVAGFERYRDCMAEAGMPLLGGDTSSEIIQYSTSSAAVDSGVENQCYRSEFSELDMQWQVEHPQMSLEQQSAYADGEVSRDEYLAGFDRYAACLAGIGATVTVADPDAEVLDYTVDAAPALSEQAGRCYRFEFFSLDMTWRQTVGG